MTTTAPAPTRDLEAKIDALTEQVAFLTHEARIARQRRVRWEEFQEDAMPIAGDFVEVLTRELDDLSRDVTLTDLGDLARRLVRMAPTIDRALGQLEAIAELFNDLMPLSKDVMDAVTGHLETLDRKGYFTFAKSGLGVIDEIVTNFSREDVDKLGDNVVLILETVKEMTQPEIMAVLYRMIDAIQRQQRQMEQEPGEAPGFFSLLRQMRDPEIRKGIQRALNTLRAVSDIDTGPPRQFVSAGEQEQTRDTAAGGN